MHTNRFDPHQQNPSQPPQLFEDTSQSPYGYQGNYMGSSGVWNSAEAVRRSNPVGQQNLNYNAPGGFPGAHVASDPLVANLAAHYGSKLVGEGSHFVDQKIGKYVDMNKLKYYFAVDSSYVMKKLKLLVFPFAHSDWSVRYDQEALVQPRYELNAPDLYIPLMSFMTYILLAGLCLGLQNRFSPDVLGLQASSAIVWLIIEIIIILLSFYVTAIHSRLQLLDLLAFSSYKFVGMNSSLVMGLLLDTLGYYCILAYVSLTLVIFLFRTLRWQIQGGNGVGAYSVGNKRHLYVLFVMSGVQPLLMWWLTRHLVPGKQAELPLMPPSDV